MTDTEIFAAIDAAFHDDPRPSIGLSGGEAFLFFDRLCKIIAYITNKGGFVSINTNGFWGVSPKIAAGKVLKLLELNVTQLVVSIDSFHDPYIPRVRALNVIRACKEHGLRVELQFVATKSSDRLADLLRNHGDALMGIECREIACHPVGRAAVTVKPEDLITEPHIPQGRCPASVMSISADGRVIPCCNAAGHLPALELGKVNDDLSALQQKFLHDPVLNMIRARGPKALLPFAEEAGYQAHPGRYVDQCHLCHDLHKDPRLAKSISAAVQNALEEERFQELWNQYRANLLDSGTNEGNKAVSTTLGSTNPTA
jgi:hypothetical protein